MFEEKRFRCFVCFKSCGVILLFVGKGRMILLWILEVFFYSKVVLEVGKK